MSRPNKYGHWIGGIVLNKTRECARRVRQRLRNEAKWRGETIPAPRPGLSESEVKRG